MFNFLKTMGFVTLFLVGVSVYVMNIIKPELFPGWWILVVPMPIVAWLCWLFDRTKPKRPKKFEVNFYGLTRENIDESIRILEKELGKGVTREKDI